MENCPGCGRSHPKLGVLKGCKFNGEICPACGKLHPKSTGEDNPLAGAFGPLNPFFGRTHSEATRKLISEKNRGRVYDEATHKLWSLQRKGANNGMYGRKHSAETRDKIRRKALGRRRSLKERMAMSERTRGSKHFNYGKPAFPGAGRGIGSFCLKSHWVRSTWEREVADLLFLLGIEYEYEPKSFELGNDHYRPDFYLIVERLWLEVKGYHTPRSDERIRRFRDAGNAIVVIDEYRIGKIMDLMDEIYPEFIYHRKVGERFGIHKEIVQNR